jgi:hypothetical protein
MSFRRKPESSYFKTFWTPAFAGVTSQLTFYETIKWKARIPAPAPDSIRGPPE